MGTERKLASPEDSDKETSEFHTADLARLFHYPSIGQLFGESNTTAMGEFSSRMITTRDELEKIVRHGSREDADKAGVVIRSINVTLDFLTSLQEMRLNEK